MAHTDRDRTLATLCKKDRAFMRAERRRQRRRDRHLIRTTRISDRWGDYSHPLHPFDPYGLPSW